MLPVMSTSGISGLIICYCLNEFVPSLSLFKPRTAAVITVEAACYLGSHCAKETSWSELIVTG